MRVITIKIGGEHEQVTAAAIAKAASDLLSESGFESSSIEVREQKRAEIMLIPTKPEPSLEPYAFRGDAYE